MNGIGVSLPLYVDNIDGHFSLIKNISDEIKQNMRNIIMTNPGERVMDLNFGVGIRRYLFEPLLPQIADKIRTRIYAQTERFLPGVVINDIGIEVGVHDNMLGVAISYQIPNIGAEDLLMLDFAENN
tara:strand:- start:893 stop:1273 length:381 start_codon:yes stop_codon:yes gene_type:complete